MSKGPWKKKIAQGGEAMKRLQEKRLEKMRLSGTYGKPAPPSAFDPTPVPSDPPKVETSLNNKQDANVIQGNPDAPVGNAPPVESAAPTGDPLSLNAALDRAESGETYKMTPSEVDGLSELLEMAPPSILKFPIFVQGAKPDPEVSKRWAKFMSRVIAKKLERPLTDGECALLATVMLFAPSLDFEKISGWIKPKPKEEVAP